MCTPPVIRALLAEGLSRGLWNAAHALKESLETCHGREGSILGHFFNEVLLKIVVESTNDCLNVLVTDI